MHTFPTPSSQIALVPAPTAKGGNIPATSLHDAKRTPASPRWTMIYFPCLEGVVPHGRVIMVSDKKHIPEAIRKYPDLVLWHEKELALYSEQTDSDVFDERTFIAVNRLKHKTHGWFMGTEDADSFVSAK